MPKAEVYYYSRGLGHTGVNVIFSENEVPDQDEYTILVYSKDDPPSHWEEQCKLNARKQYRPVVFLNKHGDYSIYGYKDGAWTETYSTWWPDEFALLQSLPFEPVFTEENDTHYKSSYQNGSWQKTALPEDPIYCGSSEEHVKIKPSDPLYKLMQKGHPQFKRTEYFFDFGGLYDFNENRNSRGEPIKISLPPTTKSFTEFFKSCEYPYKGQPDIPAYDLLTHNCAHATLEILHCAGYTSKKPGKSFALMPITAAKKACDLGRQSRDLFRKQLIKSAVQTDPKQLINSLIELSINRLHDNTHFNYGNYIGGCAKEMETLSNLNYDGSLEAVERLLKASEEASAYTAKELDDCIALLDPKICFNAGLARLESVTSDLKSKKSASRLKSIATKLRTELENFKGNPSSYELFAKNCFSLLNEVAPILKKESSVGLKIIKNIALAICGLIVFYLIASFINKSNSGNFLFFNEPCREKIETEIQANIIKLKSP